jgi:hypothetical protein
MEPVGEWRLQAGVGVEATAGAFLGFDFTDLPEALSPGGDLGDAHFESILLAMRKRVQVINAFALCLHSATVQLDNLATEGFRVTHEDLVHFDSLERGFGGPGLARLPVVPGVGYVVPANRHGVCSADVIHRACTLLDYVLLSKYANALELSALMNHALTACKGHDFELAVVTAWTVCEVLLDTRWREYTERQSTAQGLPINRKRREVWAGRDFSASVVVEVLTLAGAIPAELKPTIDDVRRKRNRWIHGISNASYRDGTQAIELACDMLREVIKLELHLAPTIGVSGL